MKRAGMLFIILLSLLSGIVFSHAAWGNIDFYSKKAGDSFYPSTASNALGTADARPYFRGWASTSEGTIWQIAFDIEAQSGELMVRYHPRMDLYPADKDAILDSSGGINAVRFEGTMDILSNKILTPGTTYVLKIHVFYKAANGKEGVYALPGLPDSAGNKTLSSISMTYRNSKTPPAVLDMGDGYSVTWVTDRAGIGWISYKYKDKNYTVYDQKNGLKRTDDNIHFVKVPKSHLDNNSYSVHFRPVTKHETNSATYGTEVNLGTYNFRGYRGQGEIKMLTLSDVHGYGDLAKKTVYQQNITPDLILLNGDIYNYLQEKSHLQFIFNLAGDLSGGECPVFYLRGNHETRGKFASNLLSYLPTATGEFYYTSSYGPVRIICMDMGEDKADSHAEYGGLVEFAKHRKQELAWLKSLSYDDSYTYTINFCHTPFLSNNVDTNYAPTLSSLGVSLSIAGHTHSNDLRVPTANIPFYVFVEGAHQDGKGYIGSLVTLKNGKDAVLRSFDMSAKQTFSQTIDLSTVKRTMQSAEEEICEEAEIIAIAPEEDRTMQADISITAPPVIFETGGDDFTICWETSVSGTGSVIYTYNGTTYTVNDAVGGNIRSQDTIHSVKVPKKHLLGNSYKVYSKNIVKHEPYAFADGGSVTSKSYFCVNPNASETIEMVVVPDLKATTGNEGYSDMAKAAVDALKAHPRLLILNGDASTDMVFKAQLGAMLRSAAKCGGSFCPTVFVRGNLDCRGSFAYHLMEYLKPAGGQYYYQFTYGNVSAIVLDGGEDKPDNHKEYSGLVDFTAYRAEQTKWLQTVNYDKNAKVKLVIKHFQAPLAHFADDWESILAAKGTNLALYGNAMQIVLTKKSQYGYPELICGGINGARTDFLATRITFSDHYAYIYGMDKAGNVKLATTLDLLDASVPKFGSAVKPPTENGVYLLSLPEHLLWMQEKVASGETFAGQTFKMVKSIDMKLVPMKPIGGNVSLQAENDTATNVPTWFEGTFDGNGCLIQNLHIDGAYFVGLFGLVKNAKIQNTEIYGGRVGATGQYVGSLSGSVINTTVENCGSDAVIYTEGNGKAGGLVGFTSQNSTLIGCTAASVLKSKIGGILGGITGQIFSGTINITDCYFAGEVWAENGGTVGGIAGYGGNLTGKFSGCYNRGKLYGAAVGQILSEFNKAGSHTAERCYYVAGNMPYAAFSVGDTMAVASGSYTVSASSDMKAQSFPSNLSNRYIADSENQNEGYPILAWQKYVAPQKIGVSGKNIYSVRDIPEQKVAAENAYGTDLIVTNQKGEIVDITYALPIGKYTAKPVAYDKYGKDYEGTAMPFYVSQNGYVYPDVVGSTVSVITSADCPTDKVIVASYDADGRMTGVKTYTKDEEKTYTAEDAASLKVFLWQGIMPQAVAEEKSL